ncbi:MAG: helix-turn-helix transcriptional regulator [Clostridiaceae bacterium]|nr:helix-turn-helix transcriptional regulator [Clostridiaceae bacterium]
MDSNKQDLVLFGKRLKEARKQQGLSQQELADRLGTSKSMVSAYENGSSDPRQSMIPLMASVLKVSIVWLLTGEKEVEKTERERSYLHAAFDKDLSLLSEEDLNALDEQVELRILRQRKLQERVNENGTTKRNN